MRVKSVESVEALVMYQSLSQREWGLFLRVFDNNPREEEIPHAAGSHWKHRESLQGGQDFSLMPGKDTIAPMPASPEISALRIVEVDLERGKPSQIGYTWSCNTAT